MSGSRRNIRLVAVVLTLLATACGAGASPSASDVSTTTTDSDTTTSTVEASTTMIQPNPDQADLIESATADLAGRLGVDPGAVTLVDFKDVTWPDGSLGCPEPGKSYTQALVEGYQILLRHRDRLFDYHGADDGEPFLCRSGEKDGGYGFVPPPGFDE